jgi:hypothetical protein
MDWIDEMTRGLADAAGLEPSDLALAEPVREEILDLARIASHTSGDRINAPLLCYALGLAVGRGASLDELSRIVRAAEAQAEGGA